MSDLAVVAVVAVGTLLMRASLVALLGDVTIPTRIGSALRLVAPAVLAGLVAQTLVLDDGAIRGSATWYLAALLAALVAWRTRSVGLTLALGMVAIWVLEALAP